MGRRCQMNNEKTPFKIANYDLSLNRYLWTRPEKAAQMILYYSVLKQSEKLKLNDKDAFRQIVMYYYRHMDFLPHQIRNEFEQMEDFPDNDYYGTTDANGKGFEPNEEIEYLTTYSTTHPDFLEECREWFKWYVAFSGDAKFGLNYDDSKYRILGSFRKYYPTRKTVPTSLPVSILLQFEKAKTPHDFALLAMYSAVRSIVGRKPVADTTRAFIHARMFGAKDETELSVITKSDKHLKKNVEEWRPEKHRRKYKSLLDSLRRRNLINYYGDSKRRRIFISLEIDDKTFARDVAELIKSKKTSRPDVAELVNSFL